jgi:histidinol-phosphate aminotransferase
VATLDAGDRAVFPWPSFPSYAASAACCGGEPVQVPLSGRAFDLAAVLEAARGGRVKLVYLANPNNPTGTLLDRDQLRRFIGELPEGVLCVLDEAYAEYAEPEPAGIALVREGRASLCVLRTFSKLYGLAALRIGYALAAPEVADALDRVRPIFNVNQPAQEAALASLREGSAVALRVEHARRERGFLERVLGKAGLDPEPSQANFVYAEVPAPAAGPGPPGSPGSGERLAERLLREGFIVRALGGFGAPDAIRVTAGTEEEDRGFAEALRRVLG